MEAVEIVASPEEQSLHDSEAIERANDELGRFLQVVPGSRERRPTAPKLVFEDGRKVDLPPHVLRVLKRVLHHMSRGDAIGLVPMSKMLTTNQAAEILNVSRPFLTKLLNEGAIRYTKVGTHHRIRMHDVIKYKQRRDGDLLKALGELADSAQEAENYFDD